MSVQLASCDYKGCDETSQCRLSEAVSTAVNGCCNYGENYNYTLPPQANQDVRSSRGPPLPDEALLENVVREAMRVNFELRTLTTES